MAIIPEMSSPCKEKKHQHCAMLWHHRWHDYRVCPCPCHPRNQEDIDRLVRRPSRE